MIQIQAVGCQVNQQYVNPQQVSLLRWHNRNTVSLLGYSCQNQGAWIQLKTFDEHKLRDSQQSNWAEFVKNVKVIKKQEYTLRNCSREKETNETTINTACDLNLHSGSERKSKAGLWVCVLCYRGHHRKDRWHLNRVGRLDGRNISMLFSQLRLLYSMYGSVRVFRQYTLQYLRIIA